MARDPQRARVSLEQRRAVDALMRDAPLDIGGEVAEQRAIVEQMMASFGRADDVATSDTPLGGVPAMLVETGAALADRVVLYLHGGAYALGSADGGAGLAAEVGRRTRARAYSLEYRLAPEYPYPAAIEDCTPPIAVCSTADSMPARSPSPANRRELGSWRQPSFKRRPPAYPNRRAQH